MSGNYPASVINEALDAAGVDFTIGEPNEGTGPSNVALRHYQQCLRQLTRAVHWDFARKQEPLLMLADATGQTADVGNKVIAPWRFEYAYPVDCMKARFLPANWLNPNSAPQGNYTLPDTPLTTVPVATPIACGVRLIPAPFLLALDTNYPVDPNSNWMEMQGESPAGRVVILTNVNMAQLVYTGLIPFPSVWDSQFRAALVAMLASRIAMPLAKDKRFGLQMRDQQFAIAKKAVNDARVTNGNEAGSPQSIDHLPDFVAIRASGGGQYANGGSWNVGAGSWGGGGLGWNGFGFLNYGFDQSVF